jgi:hypothetical protein
LIQLLQTHFKNKTMKQTNNYFNLKNNKMKTMKKSIVLFLFLALIAQVANAQTTITVGPGMNWTGYMNVFDLNNAYVFGSGWAVPDMKTEVDANNGSMRLKPNYNTYANAANAADSAFWQNGTLGNKIMEANTYVESLALLGQNFTFNGFADSVTINSGYTVYAFIKVLDANNGYSLVLSSFDTITSAGAFSTNVNIPNTPGFVPQYGFAVVGLNASPINEAAYGSVLIRGNNLPPAPPINVTFQVQSPDSLPVYVFGNWNNWSNWPGTLMTATTNGIYEATISLPSGDTIEYLYVNGGTPNKEVLNPADACTNGDAVNTNRMVILDTMDVTYCNRWASCSVCIPADLTDLSNENMQVRISNQFLVLETSELSAVDGIEIFDIVGKKVFSSNGQAPTNQAINIDLEMNKFYLVRIANEGSFRTIKAFITQ